MNWRKVEKDRDFSSEAGCNMQPVFELDENGVVAKTDEYDCQKEIDSHLEETLIEPQIVQAKLMGKTLSKEQTGAYVDLSAMGKDFVENQMIAQYARDNDLKGLLEKALEQMNKAKEPKTEPTPAQTEQPKAEENKA